MSRSAPHAPDGLALVRYAAQTESALCAQDEAWAASGWTRRRFLSGLGMAGVAALGSQLVTTRVAYGASTAGTRNTLITVFLRGAADGLRILVPASAALGVDYLHGVRAALVPPSTGLISLPGTGGWALNAAMRPLYNLLWNTGELAFVPAVASPSVSRSHFQSQQMLERGGSAAASTVGSTACWSNSGRALPSGPSRPAPQHLPRWRVTSRHSSSTRWRALHFPGGRGFGRRLRRRSGRCTAARPGRWARMSRRH